MTVRIVWPLPSKDTVTFARSFLELLRKSDYSWSQWFVVKILYFREFGKRILAGSKHDTNGPGNHNCLQVPYFGSTIWYLIQLGWLEWPPSIWSLQVEQVPLQDPVRVSTCSHQLSTQEKEAQIASGRRSHNFRETGHPTLPVLCQATSRNENLCL